MLSATPLEPNHSVQSRGEPSADSAGARNSQRKATESRMSQVVGTSGDAVDYKGICERAMASLKRTGVLRHIEGDELISEGYLALARKEHDSGGPISDPALAFKSRTARCARLFVQTKLDNGIGSIYPWASDMPRSMRWIGFVSEIDGMPHLGTK
jgi:hypothetical protein